MHTQAANYGSSRSRMIPEMARTMGMGRYRDPNAGKVSGRGAEMARQAVGSAPSDATAAAFLRALGGNPAGMGPMPGMGSGYQDELKRMAFALQQQGRMGDTVLAHINPQEAQMLHQNTDGGSINPQTGLLEFWSDGPGGPGGQGGQDSSGMGGGGTTDSTSNDNSQDSPDGAGTQGGNTGAGGRGLGGNVSDPHGMGGFGEGAIGGPNPGGAPGHQGGQAGSVGGPGPGGATGGTGGGSGQAPGQAPVGGFRSVMEKAAEKAGFPQNPGMMSQQAVVNSVLGLGPGTAINGLVSLLDATMERDSARTGKADPAPGGDTGGSEGGVGSPFVKPSNVAAPTSLSRPAAMDAPSFLDFESDDPLQRRAKIATFATQGTGGKWATDEAFDYWKNLTQRGLISDAGQMPDFANLLGTELGYLGSRGIAAPNQTRALLEAILSS